MTSTSFLPSLGDVWMEYSSNLLWVVTATSMEYPFFIMASCIFARSRLNVVKCIYRDWTDIDTWESEFGFYSDLTTFDKRINIVNEQQAAELSRSPMQYLAAIRCNTSAILIG